MVHTSVLLEESIANLNIKKDGIYVDATVGRAGHSSEILRKLTTGYLYGFDLDQDAIEQSKKILAKISDRYVLINDNYINMKKYLTSDEITHVDGILMDLGVSSPQFDDAKRGFSYRLDGPLDMRMNKEQKLSAYEIVNTWSLEELIRIFYRYGEEAYAKQIARNIVKSRALRPIETTFELVDVIKGALPEKVKRKKGHPAKKCFQAIRITVNNELEVLETAIVEALDCLAVGGRLVVISFHSLEDRIVKTIFKEYGSATKLDKNLPIKAVDLPQADYQVITKKPILPTDLEVEENNRAHSAKLRVIERKCT